jgi:spermidine synthase
MTRSPALPENPAIELVERDGELTLSIDGGQAMQAWERELMHQSADLLCTFGTEFLEVGLGLGLSALRIASNARTRRHVVVERYARVVELFRAQHPALPPTLEIVCADWFEHVEQVAPESVDGIFFDPALPESAWNDASLWDRIVPMMRRALRPGGALVPFFTTRPYLRWQYVPHFDRVIVERRSYQAYSTTHYTSATAGDAFIQCFVKTT